MAAAFFDEQPRLLETVERLLPVVEFMAKERGSMAAHEKYDRARKMAKAALGEQS
jgi:hypothetical protein